MTTSEHKLPGFTSRPVAAVLLPSAGEIRICEGRRAAVQDPAFRLIGSEQIWERGAALTNARSSF